jgi:ClpP class serine protease
VVIPDPDQPDTNGQTAHPGFGAAATDAASGRKTRLAGDRLDPPSGKHVFLGFPVARYIDIQDSEEIMRAIKMTDPKIPIDIILHTPGGLVLAAEQIAYALAKRKGKVTVFIPHYAMSGGTMIALAADEIVMDDNAVLGPVDPQLGNYPAVSILKVLDEKPAKDIDDETLIQADIARKAIAQVKATIQKIACCQYSEEAAHDLAEKLASGQWTHDYPISFEEAKELGLKVSEKMPEEIYKLMNLYPQARARRPSVEYIPLPTKSGPAFPSPPTAINETPKDPSARVLFYTYIYTLYFTCPHFRFIFQGKYDILLYRYLIR